MWCVGFPSVMGVVVVVGESVGEIEGEKIGVFL